MPIKEAVCSVHVQSVISMIVVTLIDMCMILLSKNTAICENRIGIDNNIALSYICMYMYIYDILHLYGEDPYQLLLVGRSIKLLNYCGGSPVIV